MTGGPDMDEAGGSFRYRAEILEQLQRHGVRPTGRTAPALVHEAYLRLAGAGTPWHDRRHFIGIAARSMRQILVERARARGAQKRWAGMDRVSLTDALAVAADPESILPSLDDALGRLET